MLLEWILSKACDIHSSTHSSIMSVCGCLDYHILYLPTDPPNITAPPSELSPSNITTCCAGVRLNLADPDDVSDVSVLLNTSSDGSYEMVSAGNLTRSGDILYIMGLQAGTVYTASITVSNIFGSTTWQITLKPLLGM